MTSGCDMRFPTFKTLATLLLLLTGCASTPQTNTPSEEQGRPITTKSYEELIEEFSDGDTQYSGFYNNFEYKATLLNSKVRSALLARQNEYYQWDREKWLSEKEKSEQEAASETVVFLSFFTPERRNDNLADSKSIWRIYLDVGGRRYEGKVKKVRLLLAELQALYPYHTRWNTPYLVTFPVPTNAIETQDATFTVTGPLGSRTVKFPRAN